MLELARDITESAHQRAFTTRLIDGVPAPLAVWDRDLVIRWANPAYCQTVGIPAERLIGHTMSEAFGPEFDTKLLPITQQILETGQPYHEVGFAIAYEVEGQRRQTYWDFTHAPVFGADGRRRIGVLVHRSDAVVQHHAPELTRTAILMALELGLAPAGSIRPERPERAERRPTRRRHRAARRACET